MNEQEIISELEREGFFDVTVHEIEANYDLGQHVNEKPTVHIILSGELIITSRRGKKSYTQGDRVEFRARAKYWSHTGRVGPLRMIVGTKTI